MNTVARLEREVQELQSEVRLVRCGRGDREDNLAAVRAQLTRKKLQLKQALGQYGERQPVSVTKICMGAGCGSHSH